MSIGVNKGVFALELGYYQSGTATEYYSDGNLVSGPSDTPANTVFLPRLVDPGSYERYLYRSNTTGGKSQAAFGNIVLDNSDGGLDSHITRNYDGRSLVLRYGTLTGAYPGGLTTLFNGTALNAMFGWNTFIIILRDMQEQVANKLMQTTTFAGTNSGTTGVEGLPADLKGKYKPVVYGQCFNMPSPCVNTSSLAYQVSQLPLNSLDAVYDKGVALTPGTARASLALLLAAAPGAGTYDYYLGTAGVDGAYFKLGASPAGQVTADATQGANAAARTVAQIIKTILTGPGGLVVGNLDTTSFTNLDTANASVVGVYIDENGAAIGNVIDELCQSIGAWWSQTRSGLIRVGQLSLPASSPVVTLEQYEVLATINRLQPGNPALQLPIYQAQLGYKKNYRVQTSTDLAGGATDAQKAYALQQYRSATTTNIGTLTSSLLSQPLQYNTLLTTEANANAEAARVLSLYGSRRDTLEVSAPRAVVAGIELGDCITLKANRYDWTGSGKNFIVIGINDQYAKPSSILTVFG